MTELEKIARARMYMDKLANGINPLDGTPIPDEDLINNVRLVRCFFFVSDVLRRVLENGGTEPAPGAHKPKKAPFSLSAARRELFAFSGRPIPASEIANRLNALADDPGMEKITYRMITGWLIDAGMLLCEDDPWDKSRKYPTAEGKRQGITLEERTGSQGPYRVVVYDIHAQHLILDNFDAILNAHAARTAMVGQPWTPDHDGRLRELCQKGIAVSEIADTLQRSTKEVRARIKRLGLVGLG